MGPPVTGARKFMRGVVTACALAVSASAALREGDTISEQDAQVQFEVRSTCYTWWRCPTAEQVGG
eukprot:12986286-Ditylum_brightwellii.AAC.1